jgi:hypothetical protein
MSIAAAMAHHAIFEERDHVASSPFAPKAGTSQGRACLQGRTAALARESRSLTRLHAADWWHPFALDGGNLKVAKLRRMRLSLSMTNSDACARCVRSLKNHVGDHMMRSLNLS